MSYQWDSTIYPYVKSAGSQDKNKITFYQMNAFLFRHDKRIYVRVPYQNIHLVKHTNVQEQQQRLSTIYY